MSTPKPKKKASTKRRSELEYPTHIKEKQRNGELPDPPVPLKGKKAKAKTQPDRVEVAPPGQQGKLDLQVPISRVGLVLGLDEQGNLYHNVFGNAPNVIELAGLAALAGKIVDRYLDAAVQS